MRKSVFLLAAMCCASVMAGTISDFEKQSNIDYVGDSKTYHKMDIYFPMRTDTTRIR